MAESPEDAFAKAFSEAANRKETPLPASFAAAIEPPAPVPPPEPVAEAAKEHVEAVKEPVEAAAPVEPTAAVVEPPAPVVPPEKPLEPARATPADISDADLLKRFASLVRQPPAHEEPPARVAPAQAGPTFTEDETKLLAAYEKDWPDVAKAEALRRRADLQAAVGYIFQEIAQNFGPVVQTTQRIAEQQQVSNLRAYAGDYDQIREQVISWVDTQPDFLKSSMKEVVSHGTYDQVTSLMDLWRKSTAPTQAASPAVVDPKPVLTDAARKAAAALAPVSGKRSGAATTVPEDFAGAFAMYAKRA